MKLHIRFRKGLAVKPTKVRLLHGIRIWHSDLTCALFLMTDKFPPSLTVPLSLKSSLRYGENPHQKAAFYVDKRLSEVNGGGIATAIQHHGKV